MDFFQKSSLGFSMWMGSYRNQNATFMNDPGMVDGKFWLKILDFWIVSMLKRIFTFSLNCLKGQTSIENKPKSEH